MYVIMYVAALPLTEVLADAFTVEHHTGIILAFLLQLAPIKHTAQTKGEPQKLLGKNLIQKCNN